MENDSLVANGMALPQRILFPPEKICMEWQQRRRAGAGLRNAGTTCFVNVVLQCLTYTPPLASYLLSREHSGSCRQQGFCMMCIMEAHVNEVLHTPASAIMPTAIINALPQIGECFKLGMPGDACEFFCCIVIAMHRACMSGHSDWDISTQATTIIHQIFGGFMRSRVTCCSCNAVFDSCLSFLDISLDIKAASSVTAALENFVKPEQLGGENSFRCSKCDKMLTAFKKVTIDRVPRVLTLQLNRADATGEKIHKFVQYPPCFDLRPYISQAAAERLHYALYAVVVHIGDSCRQGHFLCYTKASNGLWYQMDDVSVNCSDLNTVLKQQAYLLFYVRCSDVKTGQQTSSSSALSYACSYEA